MSNRVGFVTMGAAGTPMGEVPTLGVGMLGYAFMGKAHTNAYKKLDYIYTPPPARARLVAIAGRNRERVEAAARHYPGRSPGPDLPLPCAIPARVDHGPQHRHGLAPGRW